jgi:hypothetical protein
MTIPFAFPDWVPSWVQLLLVIVAVLAALAFLLMPFSVFGVKSRLEQVELRLEEIQAELRLLAHRLPEPVRGPFYEDEPIRAPDRARADLPARPPIPPAPVLPERSRGRSEPRL